MVRWQVLDQVEVLGQPEGEVQVAEVEEGEEALGKLYSQFQLYCKYE